MRKRLKTTPARTAADDIKAGAALPAFNEKPGAIRLRFFWIGAKGAFSKRSFFFSMFAFVALIYVVLCASTLIPFSAGLGTFILGCNTAFGINYYRNERDKETRYEHERGSARHARKTAYPAD